MFKWETPAAQAATTLAVVRHLREEQPRVLAVVVLAGVQNLVVEIQDHSAEVMWRRSGTDQSTSWATTLNDTTTALSSGRVAQVLMNTLQDKVVAIF
jgi:hypothetical protein